MLPRPIRTFSCNYFKYFLLRFIEIVPLFCVESQKCVKDRQTDRWTDGQIDNVRITKDQKIAAHVSCNETYMV